MNFLVAYAKLAEQVKAIENAANEMNEVFREMNKASAQFDADDLRDYLYDHLLSAVSMHDASFLHDFTILVNSSQFAKLREHLAQFSNEQLKQMSDDQQAHFIRNAIRIAQEQSSEQEQAQCERCNRENIDAYYTAAQKLSLHARTTLAMFAVYVESNKAFHNADDIETFNNISLDVRDDADMRFSHTNADDTEYFDLLRTIAREYIDKFNADAADDDAADDATESHCIVCNSHNAQLVCCCDDCIDNAMKVHSDETDFVDDDE